MDFMTLKSAPIFEMHTRIRRVWPSLEDGLITVILGAMMLLPVAEMAMRGMFHTGIFAAAALEQHLALIVAMLGAAIAARENRLLALSILPTLLRDRARIAAVTFAGTIAVTVCLLLGWASYEFVVAESHGGRMLTQFVPVWLVQSVMPAGFVIIAWRLLRHTVASTHARLAVIAVAIIGVITVATQASGPDLVTDSALILLAAAAILGAPLFAVIGGVALILFWSQGVPVAAVAIDQYRMVVNPTLPAIPLFTLAGYLLAESRAPERLLRLFQALFGGSRSGAAGVAVAGSCLLTSFTGASGVTILALGGLLLPMLVRWRYTERAALGVVTGSGLPGVLLAPSLPLILFAVVAEVSVRDMFLGALPPAVLMIALVFGWSRWQGTRCAASASVFDKREALAALAAAKWELALPFVAIGALFSGWATPVEAAAITALYALIVETLIHGDLKLVRDLPRVMSECGLLVGGILLILGMALGMTNYLVDAQVPERLTEWIQGTVHSPWVFLLALNVFLLAAGCLMDIYAAIIVLTPLIVPLALAFGIDPVHLGVLFLANLELGYLTPPVGINLFYSASRFKRPLLEVCRSVCSLIPVLAIGVLIITYVPALTHLLRDW